MDDDPNPYRAPQTSAGSNGRIGDASSVFRVLVGSVIGLFVGVPWAAVLEGGLNGRACLIVIWFVATGLVVGIVRRLPLLVGPVLAPVGLIAVAIAFGPRDGWIILVIEVFGIVGVLGGSVIGVAFWLTTEVVRRRRGIDERD
jgi:hypothetical protein